MRAFANVVTAISVNFGGYFLWHRRLDFWNPNVFLLALLSGIVALILVSLITPCEAKARVEKFYRRHDVVQ